jgi:dihydroxyacetone kinase
MSARSRRLFNNPNDAVEEMLEGYALAHDNVIAYRDGLVIRAKRKPDGLVGLVIANGSGHEPAMIGWIGPGLLDVNVPGPIFSSPGPARIVAGIREADRGAGVVLLVSSHAGDIMNATLAIDDAGRLGIDVAMVVLYDDIASAPRDHLQDRRGGAGLFFVWKLVGAAAEQGASLADCVATAERVRDRSSSISAALGTVIHPITGQPLGTAQPDELSVGLGVHGEPGRVLGAEVPADEVAGSLVETLAADADIQPGARVALMVNNAGSLTLMELSILYRAARQRLETHGVVVARSWIGAYATTLDLAGFAIALCVLDRELEELYDAPAQGAGFTQLGTWP